MANIKITDLPEDASLVDGSVIELASLSGGAFASKKTLLSTLATYLIGKVNAAMDSVPLPISRGGTGTKTAADARTSLGFGTISTQAANNILITGGAISGITDLAIADGGTGASSAPAARSNLGLSTVAATGLDTDLAGAAWTTFTPTLSAGTGTLTSATATGRYKRIGKTVWFYVHIEITTNGTAASSVNFTLPFVAAGQTTSPADRWPFHGREDNTVGLALQGKIQAGTSLGQILRYNNQYVGGDGVGLFVSGMYEGV